MQWFAANTQGLRTPQIREDVADSDLVVGRFVLGQRGACMGTFLICRDKQEAVC